MQYNTERLNIIFIVKDIHMDKISINLIYI
jgi:hypothetical protein